MGMPAAMSTRAALIFVIMPPLPTPDTAPPAAAKMSRPDAIHDGNERGRRIDLRVRRVQPVDIREDHHEVGVDEAATSAAKVSLSPKRICSTDTVSFSFTMGTTDSSRSRSSVSLACR